jgi:hypothetical protein
MTKWTDSILGHYLIDKHEGIDSSNVLDFLLNQGETGRQKLVQQWKDEYQSNNVGVTPAPAPARRRVRIPLRETAAGSRAEDNRTNVDEVKSSPTSIRYVLLVVSHPTAPTAPQTAAFLMDILPELDTQHHESTKIGTLWVTTPIAAVDMAAKAAEAFGPGIVNNEVYTYRTLQLKLKEGDAKCLVVYDKAVNSDVTHLAAPSKPSDPVIVSTSLDPGPIKRLVAASKPSDPVIPPDPVMDRQEAMMNAAAFALRADLDDSIQFLYDDVKCITGIWLAYFPVNTTKKAVLEAFINKELARKLITEATADPIIDKIYGVRYTIKPNPRKGGFDVCFEVPQTSPTPPAALQSAVSPTQSPLQSAAQQKSASPVPKPSAVPVEPSIADEFRIANENLRRLGALTITPIAGASDKDKLLQIFNAYLEATDKPITMTTDRSYLLNMQTALEHSEKITNRMDRITETANSPPSSEENDEAARSVEREYEIANGHLRSLGASPVQPPTSGTKRDRLMPIIEAYKRVMLDTPSTSEELTHSWAVLPQIAQHIDELSVRLK